MQHQDDRRDHRPDDLDRGVLVELRRLVALRFAVRVAGVEHEAEHADEDHRHQDHHVLVQVVDRRAAIGEAAGCRFHSRACAAPQAAAAASAHASKKIAANRLTAHHFPVKRAVVSVLRLQPRRAARIRKRHGEHQRLQPGERQHQPRAHECEPRADRQRNRRQRRERRRQAGRRHRAITLENQAGSGGIHERSESTTTAKRSSRNTSLKTNRFRIFGHARGRLPGVPVDDLERRARRYAQRGAQALGKSPPRQTARTVEARRWSVRARAGRRAAPRRRCKRSARSPCPSPARRSRSPPACRRGRACRRTRARAPRPRAARSSFSVSGPSVLNISSPSGASTRCELAQRARAARRASATPCWTRPGRRCRRRAAARARSAQIACGLFLSKTPLSGRAASSSEKSSAIDLRFRIALREQPLRRTAAGVEDAARRDLHVVEALEHARARPRPRGATRRRRSRRARAKRLARERAGQSRKGPAQPRPPPRACAGRSSPCRTPSGRPAARPARGTAASPRSRRGS